MTSRSLVAAVSCLTALALMTGCNKQSNPADGVPAPAKVTTAFEAEEFSVDRPDEYPLTAAV